MVQEGIVSTHKVSEKGIEVDKAKVNLIYNMPVPSSMKQLYYSLVMMVSTGDLLRILVKWLVHLLISFLKMLLLCLTSLVLKLLRSFDLCWCHTLLYSPYYIAP